MLTIGDADVSGELIRQNIVEDQAGVPLFLDLQLIDTNTCEPLSKAYIDLWHCNATGIYSGVVAGSNGNPTDLGNINKTFLRGIQQTDANGVVQFETIFPGHYTGRTVHIHVLSHTANETIRLANDTISGLYSTHASHVGQLFFDQHLISNVEASSSYTANEQALTANDEDYILLQEAEDIDPFMQYVLLGETIENGIFAWASMGIDSTADKSVSIASYHTEGGGVKNKNPTYVSHNQSPTLCPAERDALMPATPIR
ncbi:hypothetical protein EYZ11_002279 [Aspergillus tanneri]|uniref:Intradiol ring-cleavage dioxygenases domain-containing protein n=1 Tax=Aspergillus tanneri TaxID=1220188 RepID=A0A4S3JTC4_9EURO|nr:hypothetical protein EYZ11_002279 [Aspergillus tanneri]